MNQPGNRVVNQIELVCVIGKELERQGFSYATQRQLNAVIAGTDLIVKAYAELYRPAVASSGLDVWLKSDETGLSSMAMARTLAPLAGLSNRVPGPSHPTDVAAHPCDPADFGRCVGLLDAVPELRPHIKAMGQVSPEWARFVESWNELEVLYREERPRGRAPKLFARIQEICHPKGA